MSDLRHPADRLLDHAGFLQRLAHHLAGPHAGDDLLQDTWLASQRHAPAHTADVRGWFATVMTNLWRNRARDEGRRRRHEAAVQRGDVDAAAADIAAREEVRRRVVAAVLLLPAELREVVLLRYYEGLDSRAIGARLELSSSTIRTRLQAAMQRLRARLDDEHGGVRAAWAGPLAFWRAGMVPVAATSVSWTMRAAIATAGACAATWFAWAVLMSDAPPPQVVQTADIPSGAAAAPVATADLPPPGPLRVAAPPAELPRAATTEQRQLATLSGVVVSLRDGTPLPDLTIVAQGRAIDCGPFFADPSPLTLERRTTSGDGGTFTFADLPIGPYDVEVTGRAGLHAWVRVDVTSRAERIQLYATQRLSLGHVSVRVVDETGTAVPFAEVTLAVGSLRAGWFGWDERAPFRGTCDAHGRFALRDRPELAPIEIVNAQAHDATGRVGLAFVNCGSGRGTSDAVSIEVVLHAPGSLRGALTGLADYRGLQAIAYPWLGYAFASECFATSAPVAADGSFEIRGLPPIEHRVQIAGGARRADNEQFWNTRTSLVPAGGMTTTDPATIVCSPGSRVRGAVCDAAGAPVAGARVTALRPWVPQMLFHRGVCYPDERSASHWFARSRTTTDAAGRYELDLYPGTWQVVVADGERLHAAFPVVAGAEPVLEIEHRLEPGGALAGDTRHGNALRSRMQPDVLHLLSDTTFVMRGLRPGTWEVGRHDNGVFVARHTVEIVAGKTLWLEPPPRDEREHRGVLRHDGQPLADHDVSIGDRGEPVRTGADGAFVLRHVHDAGADGSTPSLCVRYRSLLIANVPQLDGDVELAGRMIEVHTTDAQGSPLPATIAIGDTFEKNHGRYATYNGPGRIDAPNGHLRCLLTRVDEHTSVVATFADGSRSLAVLGDRTVVRLVRPTTGSLRVRALDAAGLPCPGQHVWALAWGREAAPPDEPAAFIAGCADDEDRVEGTCDGDGVAELRGVPVGHTLLTVWRDGMRTHATQLLVTVAADRILDVDVRPAN